MVNQSDCALAEMLVERDRVMVEVWRQLYSFFGPQVT